MLLFLDLDPALDAVGVQAWLQALIALVRELVAKRAGQRYAPAAIGLGAPLVRRLAGADAALAERVPVGLRTPPAVPGIADPAVAAQDVCVYVMATSEGVVADTAPGSKTRCPLTQIGDSVAARETRPI